MKEITSREHPLVKEFCKLQRDAAYRKSAARVILEGKNAIQDIARSRPILRLLVSKEALIPKGIKANEIILVPTGIIEKISTVESPEGIIAEFAMPQMVSLTKAKKIVALDGIQDPGNLGTILRSALAFGWEGIFLLPGTVDPFNSKSLRAAKGATFTLPLSSGTWQDLQQLSKESQLSIIVADLTGKEPEKTAHKGLILVLGSEGQGVNVPNDIDFDRVTLPMSETMESLNVAVAGSILMYLLRE